VFRIGSFAYNDNAITNPLMLLRIIFFFLSWAGAECFVLAFLSSLPLALDTTTDIVGFPVYSNFNIDRLFLQFYAHLILLPLLAFFLYRFALRRLPAATWPSLPPSREMPGLMQKLFPHIQALGVGWALAPFALWSPKFGYAPTAIAVTLAYYAVWFRWRKVQSYALWATLLTLPAASAFTAVREPTQIVQYPWFPWWLAAIPALAGMAYASTWRSSERYRRETEWVLRIVVPVVMVMQLVHLPRSTMFEYFHDGESLVPALLSLRNYFPWRDILFSHGFLQDPFQSGFGMRLFGESFWGAATGNALVLVPIYWVLQYFLSLTLFRSHPFLLVLMFLLLMQNVPNFFSSSHFRFLLQPLALLFFLRLLGRPTLFWSAAFAVVLFTQAIITPESAYAVLAFALVLPFFEWYADREAKWIRTRSVAFVGLGLLTLWCVWLESHNALRSFFEYYTTFAPGHRYTGGIPFQDLGHNFLFVVYGTMAGTILYFWYFLSKLARRAILSTEEWMLFAIQIFTWFYFSKFVSRADTHIYSVYALSLPLLLWTLWRGLLVLDRYLPRALPPRFLPSAILAVALVYFLPNTFKQATNLPARLRMAGDITPGWPRMGYFGVPPLAEKRLVEWREFFAKHLGPDDKIFDFSNAPGLYYFLLDLRPATRFFTVSMAIRPAAQSLVIKELERDKPKLVIFQGESEIRSWDRIPNMVRHFRLSEYLLNNYHPLARIHSALVMERNDDRPVPKFTDDVMKFGFEPCDWGYTPSFQAEHWKGDEEVNVPYASFTKGDTFVTELSLKMPDWKSHRLLEIEFEKLEPDFFMLSDRALEHPLPLHMITFFSRKEGTMKYRIPVGSCMQWKGFEKDILQLVHKSPQTIRSVKLLR